MPWGPDVETNLAISSANHLKVRFIQQSRYYAHPLTCKHQYWVNSSLKLRGVMWLSFFLEGNRG
ncbi:hypothetical protein E3U36_10120 [Arsenophonus endosymbiont of Aphis craccivora]|uniref:hypothetical protein n=1 Tax=Arsenophonus endosymbiont of Aphis craccivora TaxID=1231049 RepID=UPI0015DCCCB4|nr:hypothetical protein [Arsenophonus endosymbiont of Aphis craccivora]QLK88323.1 hypothetical protein E3U36_10120 [Arsenophonus endosymbiont of Aphis craccivora]